MEGNNSKQFSVSMCVYNGDNPDYFKDALDSVLDQSLKPNEVVLVVDGPIDDSLDNVIRSFNQNNVIDFRVIRLEENVGHGEARRISLANTSNEFVALMDADDISMSDRFEKQITALENMPDISTVGSNISEFVDSTENIVGRRLVPEYDDAIKLYMKNRCPMNQVTVMFRKKDIDSVGGYIDWYCEEDYYLWLRLAINGFKFYNIQEDLVKVRVGREMYQRRGGWKYFVSESKLQWFMYRSNIISLCRLWFNCSIRFILQVIMPNKLRSFIFKKFARD